MSAFWRGDICIRALGMFVGITGWRCGQMRVASQARHDVSEEGRGAPERWF